MLSAGLKAKLVNERIRAAHFKHSKETLRGPKPSAIQKSLMFRYPTDIDNHCNMFYQQIKTRGRPPSRYTQLDLTDPEQLALTILRTLPKQ